ncbi:hypothetical protein GDO78_021885 [Eleutherodactylus coqui]|uniref:Uncharacterized protein n=1 Tax=Eleutherodactylus coqui TaxID=57060 RepID=A0A8J6BE98_ELECQ|nr:hypothetical protein GDO78_021885 [Eleutherodactylus coqui]
MATPTHVTAPLIDRRQMGASARKMAALFTRSLKLTDFQRRPDYGMVWLCHGCQLPVGDTKDWSGNHVADNVVLLKAVSQFVQIGKRTPSSDSSDAGSVLVSMVPTNFRPPMAKLAALAQSGSSVVFYGAARARERLRVAPPRHVPIPANQEAGIGSGPHRRAAVHEDRGSRRPSSAGEYEDAGPPGFR